MLLLSKKTTLLYIIGILSLIVINSCGPNKGYLAGASAYDDEEQMWNPSYRVYHTSAKTTRFYFIIPPGDILFVRNPQSRKFEASAQINYHIIKPENKTTTTIKKGVIKIDRENDEIPSEAIVGYFDVEIPDGHFYYASIVLNDKFRKHQFEDLLTIDKKNKGSAEDFIITDSTNSVKFMNYVASDSKVKISSERLKSSKFYVTRYFPISEYPLPIYVERDVQKMSITKDTTYQFNSDDFIVFEKPGIYHVQVDTTKVSGLTLLNFYEGYPLIAQRKNIAPPMRYITSDEEFEELAVGTDASKLKTEKIWASMSNDLPKTENLITTYYKRIQFANVYFTSYKEGWRTDRGLVYSIFGPPSSIYKTPKGEQWTYGTQNSTLDFEFTFEKAINPLTNNDYILIRDDDKKTIWQKAVEYWRKGKVFDQNEIVRLQEEIDRQNRYRNNYWYPSYYRGY